MKAIHSQTMSYQDELEQSVGALKMGQVILTPTDTLWALSCDMYNVAAFHRIEEITKSTLKDKFVILVDSISMLKNYIPSIHPRIETLLLYYHRPLTIIYDDFQNIPDHLINEDHSVTIRVVNDHFCGDVISILGKPLVGTIASYGSDLYPNSLSAVPDKIKSESDYIVKLDIEEQNEGLPSILARYNDKGELEFIRE